MRRSLLIAALVLVPGCAHEAPTPVPLGTLKAAIQQNESQFAQAMMRGDAVAVASLFREDAQYIPGWQKGRLEGRAAIQALFQQRLAAAHFLEVVITTGALGTDGELAYETGTNRLTRQTGDAPPVTTTGRYLTIWHHDPDGQWRIQVDMVVVDPP